MKILLIHEIEKYRERKTKKEKHRKKNVEKIWKEKIK